MAGRLLFIVLACLLAIATSMRMSNKRTSHLVKESNKRSEANKPFKLSREFQTGMGCQCLCQSGPAKSLKKLDKGGRNSIMEPLKQEVHDVKSVAKRLVKEAHENALQVLEERKAPDGLSTVHRDAGSGLRCECKCQFKAQSTCALGFACPTGGCIPVSLVCDGKADCPGDGEDESNCDSYTKEPPTERSCKEDEFPCYNSKCVDVALMCDGHNNCGDGSDELDCPNCEKNEFRCSSGKCIPTSKVCDGHADCESNGLIPDDEFNCTQPLCNVDEFLCSNQKWCIIKLLRCDGVDDCGDASDEAGCPFVDAAICDHLEEDIKCGRRFFVQDVSTSPMQSRIVGGIEAVRGAFPYQILLRKNGNFTCGGTIIDKDTVITAAHCVEHSASYSITAGDHMKQVLDECTEQLIGVARVISHPGYKPYPLYINDIAILKLVKGLTFNKYVQPACLPERDYAYKPGERVFISGWGHLEEDLLGPNILNVASVPFISKENCEDAYRGETITEDMVCAGFEEGGVDACQGDSGGPVVSGTNDGTSGFTLVGVVSWGIGCALPKHPGVYARVTHFLDWIAENR